jgi:hypothetical protein
MPKTRQNRRAFPQNDATRRVAASGEEKRGVERRSVETRCDEKLAELGASHTDVNTSVVVDAKEAACRLSAIPDVKLSPRPFTMAIATAKPQNAPDTAPMHAQPGASEEEKR